jgi:DNA-binding NtrC family response regulator
MNRHIIVLLDDEPDMLSLLEEYFKYKLDFKYRVVGFTELKEAKQFVEANHDRIRAVSSDFCLSSEEDGLSLLAFAKFLNEKASLFVITGDDSLIDKCDFYHVINKPEFIKAVDRIVEEDNYVKAS